MSKRMLFSLCGSEDTVYERRRKEPVYLNVYDLCNLNDITYSMGLGVFHSGIQVFGIEFGFGGHELPGTSGIFKMMPCNNMGDLRHNFRFRESILLGYTYHTRKEVQRIVDRMGKRHFTGRSYNIVFNNCNHFSIKLSKILCGRPIPSWVNRLANLIARVPFIMYFLTPAHQRQRFRQHRPPVRRYY